MFGTQGFIFMEDGCMYRYGMVCFARISISSLVGGRQVDYLYRYLQNVPYHNCIYSCLPED